MVEFLCFSLFVFSEPHETYDVIMGSRNYRDLIVWQKGMDLFVAVHELSEQFPSSELYGMTSQIRRAALSIPLNIAEGSKRGTRKDFRKFLLIAYGSGAEVETLLEGVKRLSWGRNIQTQASELLVSEVMRLLNRFTSAISH